MKFNLFEKLSNESKINITLNLKSELKYIIRFLFIFENDSTQKNTALNKYNREEVDQISICSAEFFNGFSAT